MKLPGTATYVMDNSVFLKPLFNENDAEKVEKILYLKDRFELSILVPDIFRYEFFNKVTREFNAVIAQTAWRAITERQFSVVPFENDLVDMANRLVAKHEKITFYDAAYHALALAYKINFITADEKYYASAKSEGYIKLLKDIKI